MTEETAADVDDPDVLVNCVCGHGKSLHCNGVEFCKFYENGDSCRCSEFTFRSIKDALLWGRANLAAALSLVRGQRDQAVEALLNALASSRQGDWAIAVENARAALAAVAESVRPRPDKTNRTTAAKDTRDE